MLGIIRFIVILIILAFIIFVWSWMVISSRCSRMEEEEWRRECESIREISV